MKSPQEVANTFLAEMPAGRAERSRKAATVLATAACPHSGFTSPDPSPP